MFLNLVTVSIALRSGLIAKIFTKQVTVSIHHTQR